MYEGEKKKDVLFKLFSYGGGKNLKKKKCRRHIFFDSCPDFIHTVLKKKTTFFLKSFPF